MQFSPIPQLLEEIPYQLMSHFTYGGRMPIVNVHLRRERELAQGANSFHSSGR